MNNLSNRSILVVVNGVVVMSPGHMIVTSGHRPIAIAICSNVSTSYILSSVHIRSVCLFTGSLEKR